VPTRIPLKQQTASRPDAARRILGAVEPDRV
jgi:hypothetical protein